MGSPIAIQPYIKDVLPRHLHLSRSTQCKVHIRVLLGVKYYFADRKLKILQTLIQFDVCLDYNFDKFLWTYLLLNICFMDMSNKWINDPTHVYRCSDNLSGYIWLNHLVSLGKVLSLKLLKHSVNSKPFSGLEDNFFQIY